MSSEAQIPVTHVIFDLDGTIVNTVDLYIDVLKDYAQSYGQKLSQEVERYVPNMTSLAVLLKMLVESLGISEEINITELGLKLLRDLYEKEFQLIPGVERLIKHLHRNNIPMAIATGNSKRHFDKIKAKFGTFFDDGNYFSHNVCGWDDIEVIKKKPHPDVYIVCAKRFQSPPNDIKNVLIIEDSINGIEGAVASGMQSLLVKDQRIKHIEINNNEVYAAIDSFFDFKPEVFGLPALASI